MTQKPLDGIIVLDLTRVLAGPYCTMILKDLGAEIIKVEMPFTGDDSRHYGPFLDEEGKKSAYFMSLNCGKKSLTLDLKKPRGKDIFIRLIEKADVLVENYRPGTLERLGFSEKRIRDKNPGIIYATASGFGYTGPDSKKAAYDLIIQALSGIMSITGTEDGKTVRVGTSVSDIVTGMYTAIGIIAALYRRSKVNVGARVDVAMLDSTVSILENAIARYQVTKEAPKPLGARHPSITPFEGFTTKDSEIIIAAGNDSLFSELCKVLGLPELAHDERFRTNSLRTEHVKDLKEIIDGILSKKTAAWWLETLTEHRIPCARINTTRDLFEYDQVKARHMLVPVEGEEDFKVPGNPVKFGSEFEGTRKEKPPALGEHNEMILKEILGLSGEEVARFMKDLE